MRFIASGLIGAACALLQPKQSHALLATVFLIVALTLWTDDRDRP